MSGYEAVRRPRLDGSVFLPALGLHVHVGLREGKLARVGISHDPHEGPIAPDAEALLARIEAYGADGRDAFRDVPLDLSGVSDFEREVLTTLVREVGPGETCTYGDLARMIGRDPGAARAIGGAMARNPIPIVVPCHRVLPAGNRVGSHDRSRGEDASPAKRGVARSARVGNYSGEGGWGTKMKLLQLEGARGVHKQLTL